MPRIKHIALTTKEPAKVAAFYKEAFGMQEIRRAPNGAVFLTDGYINLAILNWKTEKSADVGANGPNYSGIHHFGFEVEDLDEAAGEARARARRAARREGRARHGDGGRRPSQFRDEMGRPRRCGHRHLSHRLGDDQISEFREETAMADNFTICVGTVGTGAWVSPDGGESWRQVRTGLWSESRVFGFAVHPKQPRTILAGADDGVYRSEDGGEHFERLELADERAARLEGRVRSDRPRDHLRRHPAGGALTGRPTAGGTGTSCGPTWPRNARMSASRG